MEASGSVRVGVHVESAIHQPAGGLVALLTGAPKKDFASLLDGDEMMQPEVDTPAAPQRKQRDRDHRDSQDGKDEHVRNTRSSDHHRDSTGIVRTAVNTAATELRSRVWSGAPRLDSKADAQSVGGSAGEIEKASEFSVESSAMRSRGVSDDGAASSRVSKNEERSISPGSVMTAGVATRGIGDASKTKIPAMISSPSAPDAGRFDEVPVQSDSGGDPDGVPGVDVAFRSDGAGPGVGESRNGGRFAANPVIAGMHQKGGTAPSQLVGQIDLSSGTSGNKRDGTPENSQSLDIGEVGTGAVGQPEAHGGQTRHDASGQTLKAAQPTGASPRRAEGTAVELVTTGQAGAVQRKSSLVEGTPSKPMAAAEPSSREAVMQHANDASTTRTLTNAMRGELHVGLHTEAFGRVTIQTNTGPGQFSAQVSLEDSKQSAALAAHLPGVEQRILQQHGLDASVRIVSKSEAGLAGNSTGNRQDGSGRNDGTRGERRSVKTFEQGVGSTSRLFSGEVTRERQTWTPLRGRLDVIV